MQHPILVVGAGPVGLTAALFLSRAGLPVRIIDQNMAPTSLSKALVIWRRTLMELAPLIPLARMQQEGQIVQGACLCDEGNLISKVELHDPLHVFPPGLLIPQSETEGVLLEALQAVGISVERKTTCRSFQSFADHVEVELEGPNGPESCRTPFLLGCDGAHSTVRHTLGESFQGTAVPHRMLIGDLTVAVEPGIHLPVPTDPAEADILPGHVFLNSSSHGPLAIFPIGKARYRVIADAGACALDLPRQDPTLEELEQALRERSQLQWRILETHWLADFRVNERQVSNYVHGRVFLAGDAAHIHSPAGGQGMNTGMQDVINLAWKIAAVTEGAPEALLETYQAERHPVAAHVLRMTGEMLRLAMFTHPVIRMARGFVMSLALNLPAVRKKVAETMSEDDVAYRGTPLMGETEGHLASGYPFPEVPVEIDGQTRSSVDLLVGGRDCAGTLLLMPQAGAQTWPTHFGARPLLVRQWGRDFTDPTGALENELNLSPESGLLIRPDGLVAASGRPEHLFDWLQRHLAIPTEPAAAQ